MPRNALEFYERYGPKITMFSRMLRRDEETEEIEQRVWLKLFAHPGQGCRYPQAKDYIEYLNIAFAATDSTICLRKMLAYIKLIVRSVVYGCGSFKEKDALQVGGNVSLSSVLYLNEVGENSQYEPEELLLESRNTLFEPMRNDPDRVLYMQQFLGFVEQREPELLPFVQVVEDSRLNRTATDPTLRARLIALAEGFAGQRPTGRKHWYIGCSYVKQLNRPKRVRHSEPGHSFKEVLRVIEANPDGMTMKEVARSLGKPLNRVSNVGSRLYQSGHLVRTGEYRENSRVLRRTNLPFEPIDRRRKHEPLKSRAATHQGF
jgi:hypothetical protein